MKTPKLGGAAVGRSGSWSKGSWSMRQLVDYKQNGRL